MSKTLSYACIDATPFDIDWGEAFGEDCEGWRIVVPSDALDEDGCTLDAWYEGSDDCPSEEAHQPMMNYAYPVEFQGCEHEAAQAVSDAGCLTLIELRDGSYVMALTGGGMDLSWTICRGYMALGLLPPVHFCDLPRFAGYASDALEILDACRRSVKGRLQRCQRRLEDLQRLHEEIEGRKE